MNEFERVRAYLTELQDRICAAIEAVDGRARFQEDLWQRAEGGGGRTRVLRDGAVFEQAGIGFSDVAGSRLPPSASANRPELAGASWRATGVSLVFHPLNPYVPTTHANVRFFQAQRDGEVVASWFGGGFDLTPFYPFDEDVQHWHRVARDLCAVRRRTLRRAQALVRRILLPASSQRNARRRRSVLRRPARRFRARFRLSARGRRRLPRCVPADRAAAQGHPHGEREREFQLYRRGRYVEFNLVYDRGTLFGLQAVAAAKAS